jgi:tRNA (adenine57-N1/adenine58-N1)-methyltransferase
MKIRRNSQVLLVGPRSYLLACSGRFSCKYGSIDMEKLWGCEFGKKIKMGNTTFTAIQPTIRDYLFRKAGRGPQVVLPKDAAAIIGHTGCGKGWRVVDAGTGSGFLAMQLANVGCDVTTYEKRKDFFINAKKNIAGSGLKVKAVNRDIMKGIKERNADLVTLDLQNPEKAVPHAHKALKPGGWLAVYSLHTEQIIDVVKSVKRLGFSEPRTVEVLEREWQVEIYGKKSFTRPHTHMLSHTGFLTFARKV